MTEIHSEPLVILSLVFGLLSLVVGVTGPIAVVLGCMARRRAKVGPGSRAIAFANAGIATGVVGIILFGAVMCVYVGITASTGPEIVNANETAVTSIL